MASVSKRRWTKSDGSTGERWIVRYLDRCGAHRQQTFASKKDADQYRRKIEGELDDRVHVARSSSRTLNRLFDEFLGYISRRVRDGELSDTHYSSMKLMLSYASEHFGEVVLIDLRWEQVESYAFALKDRDTKHLGRKFSNVTVRKALQALNQAIGYGVRRHYAARNVVGDALKEIGKLPPRQIEHFTRQEMQRVVAAIEDRGRLAHRSQAFLRATVYLGAMCGLRRGEILGLRWSAIDFTRGLLIVNASLTGLDVLKEAKTKAGMRTVPLPRLVADALKAWEPFMVANERGLVFRTSTGKAIRDHHLYTAFWHPLLRRAGFLPVDGRHRHFHATRHFAGSAWLDAGIPLAEVSRLLGHANTAITAQIYAHAINDVTARGAEMDRVAGLLFTPISAPIAHDLRIAA